MKYLIMLGLIACNSIKAKDLDMDKFDKCIKNPKITCPYDGQSLDKLEKKLSPDQINNILSCRIEKISKCIEEAKK